VVEHFELHARGILVLSEGDYKDEGHGFFFKLSRQIQQKHRYYSQLWKVHQTINNYRGF
jgi:hypothetical protein